jgi:two-component system response regulator CpxR
MHHTARSCGCSVILLIGSGCANGNRTPDAHTRRVSDEQALTVESSQENMRPKKTILCVDDNEQALSVRKFMLETRGYRVLTAQSAHDALDAFRGESIDLVLSDLVMPGMDGNELVRRLKEIAPEIPMILISGSVKTYDRANRADAFLPKGACSPSETLERIRVMIARKRGPKRSAGLLPILPDRDEEQFDESLHPSLAAVAS